MRTYVPIQHDAKSDILRANAVAVISIAAGLAVLLLFSIIAYITAEILPMYAGASIALASMAFGVWASWRHTSMPIQARLEDERAEAEHQREMERQRVMAETKILVLNAETQKALAARVPDSAFTRPLRNDKGEVIFHPTAEISPSVPSVAQTDVVDVPGWGVVRVDLLEAIAAQWPNTSRQKLRDSGMTFENDEYRQALGVMTDALAGITEPTRYDVRVALLRVKHRAPSPALAEVVQN